MLATAARRSAALPKYVEPDGVVDQLVIGAGVVGLAIARSLSRLHDRSTFLIERNELPGQETSARNSEVVHAGIHYPIDSLKTKLCIRGRQRLYEYFEARGVPYKRLGKFTVATSKPDADHLTRLLDHCKKLDIQAELLTGAQARDLEPDLSENTTAVVHTPDSGIMDVHRLMEAFEADIVDSGQADLVYETKVTRIDRLEPMSGKGKRGDGSDEGWVVQTQSGDAEPSGILAKVVVNSAGLSARYLLNQIIPESQRAPLYHCKGSYFSYKGPGVKQVQRLLYPCPKPQFSGLGTHLTLDLAGSIRFGPDVDWMRPTPEEEADPDWWNRHLQVKEDRLDTFFEAVRDYLPGVERDGFAPDYVGIRPKLKPEDGGPSDFAIERVAPGFINLMGIESPGLTSCLAIAEMVEGLVKKEIGLGVGTGRTVSATGHADAWA